MGAPVQITKVLATADDDNVAASQTPAGAGNLTLNGVAVSSGVATLDTPRRVIWTMAGDESGKTLTLYGTLAPGILIRETLAGSTPGIVSSSLDFLTVTRAYASAAGAGAMKVGTNGVGSTPWQMCNPHVTPGNVELINVVSGTINYDIEFTPDDFFTAVNTAYYATPIPAVFDHPVLQGQTASSVGQFTGALPRGWRLTINSGTVAVTTTAIQAGISGA